ncbi:hypothetical protein LPJ59_004962 [Coemansia sp. RSA 2399]|nr:hypothetical protein LPJ59_004962 [Coemansia sp. RSA 2399]KAJ1897642.1 hypothetical protein LPJ81_004495 [Coemansia sp. IMI 209127]
MGCRKCRGWEDSECCLSQQGACACACHTSCDCAFCYTIELKDRTAMRGSLGCGKQQQQSQAAASTKTAAMRLTTVLRLESKANGTFDGSASADELRQAGGGERKSSEKARKWAYRRSASLKPLRLFA